MGRKAARQEKAPPAGEKASPPKGRKEPPKKSFLLSWKGVGTVAAALIAVACACFGASRQRPDCSTLPLGTHGRLLCEFQRAGGVVHPALEIRDHDGQRSVVVTKDVAAGELLFWAPDSVMLQGSGLGDSRQPVHEEVEKDGVKTIRVGMSFPQAGSPPPASAGESLAAALLVEKGRGPDSAFAAHVAALPARPMSYVTYPEELQAVLRSLYAFEEPERLAEQVETVRAAANASLLAPATDEEIRWALAVVSSRATGNFQPQIPVALIPLYDMLNHGHGGEPHVSCERSGSRRMGLACRSPGLKAGGEVLVNYGEHPSAAFLGRYGFLPSGLRTHRQMSLPQSSTELEAYNCTQSAVNIPYGVTEDALWEMLRCYRIGLMRSLQQNGPEIQEFASANGWFDVPLSAMPRTAEALGSIGSDRVWFLSVLEGRFLKAAHDDLERAMQRASEESLAPLLAAMRASKVSWKACFQELAEQAEAEARADATAMRELLAVYERMQGAFAWTAQFTAETAR